MFFISASGIALYNLLSIIAGMGLVAVTITAFVDNVIRKRKDEKNEGNSQ